MRRRGAAALRVSPRVATRPWEIHLALAGAQVGFALFPIFGKLALAAIPPLLFAAFRVAAAAILLDGIRRAQAPEKIRAADRPRLFLYALLGISFNQVLFIFGLFLTTAINTTILTTTIPVFTLAAAVLLGRERMGLRAGIGILLAGAGALALLNVQRFDWSNDSFRGDLLLILNCVSYSLYLVLSRPILAHYRALTFTAAVFRYGAVLIVLVAIPDLLRFQPSLVPPSAWACLAAVIVLCTVIPYLLNAWALARTHASRVAFYVFLQPLIATALAIPILGEVLTPKTVVAGLLIFAGLALTLLSGRPEPAADETLSV
jgi:drug/metabolite transporter (DMT)-like permease